MKYGKISISFRPSTSPKAIALALGAALVFTGCVSVKIGDKKIVKAEGVSFKSPSRPFDQFSAEGADQAWKNRGNGNVISFLSTCNDPADPTLDMVQSEMLSALENSKVLKTESREFNGRQGLNTEAEGFVDGVKTRIELLIFKKNDCTYSLTYVGVANRFNEDQEQFRQFVKSFEAP